jgi:hypothetical protein
MVNLGKLDSVPKDPNFTECVHENVAPSEFISDLEKSQASPGRHKCAICAYAIGYQEGLRAGRQFALREAGEAIELLKRGKT